MLSKALREFFRLESAGGILLIAAALLAMVIVNSPAQPLYDMLLNLPIGIRIADFELTKPLLLWINEGLMAVFFLVVGLEIKRETLEGELSQLSRIVLPALAAAGGMLVPALIYAAVNRGDPAALSGWAIPTATDIAFALGVLALLGPRVPNGMRLFLLTLAILDDLGAVVIIAVFYTGDLSPASLVAAAGAIAVLFVLNRRGVRQIAPYILVGLILWIAVVKSGVHATLAGVVLAFFIPMCARGRAEESPLCRLENDLHPTVSFAILPLFAFANTGISLRGVTISSLANPIPLGIALGMFLGKQIGVFGFSWAAIKLKLGTLPEGTGWLGLYGLAVLCGIGFTMSLFISSLAFERVGSGLVFDDRLGILLGSLSSAIAGFLILRRALSPRPPDEHLPA
jgi:NhaA family Na+:H+ antiporter